MPHDDPHLPDHDAHSHEDPDADHGEEGDHADGGAHEAAGDGHGGGADEGAERAVAVAEAAAADAEAAHHVVEALEGGDGFAAVGQGVAGASGALGHALHALGVHDEGVDTALEVVKGLAEAYSAVEETVREIEHMAQHGREHRAHAGEAHAGEEHDVHARPEHAAEQLEQERVHFGLRCEYRGESEWQVRDVTLTEALGRPYRAELTVVSEDLELDAGYLLGLDVTLVIERGSQRREVHGIVSRVEHGERTDTAITAKIVLVPALEALRHGARSQVYQDCTVYQVLETVLSRRFPAFQREHEIRSTREQLPREICVQFQESDLDFVHRLLEEEGMTYCFEQPLGADEREKLILLDEAERVPLRDGDDEVPFVLHRGGDFEHREPIYELVAADRIAVTDVVAVDFDWTRRGSMTVTATERDGAHPDVFSIESYEQDGRVVYADVSGDAYQRNDVAVQAVMRREAHRMDRSTYRGVGAVTWFAPGAMFDLVGHPAPGFDQSYRIVEVTHRGRNPRFGHRADEHGPGVTQSEYECSFTCIPEGHPYRPKRTTARPRIHGIQTAVVVGRDPDDIWTDARGRVRIQLHWDREGKHDERSTCWVRCVQQWAGEGHGAIFVPRVGSEVAVTFLDGDPDRPVVVGCLYNGTNPPWLDLEQDATRSGWRTGSSIAGAGYNELSFEDREGHEEVHLRAQRNLREVVLNDHTTRVGRDQSNHVGRDHKELIERHQELVVREDRAKYVDHSEQNQIGVSRSTVVGETDELTVGDGGQGVRRIQVCGEESHTVDRERYLEVRGLETELFGGGRECHVSEHDNLHVVDGANRNVTVDGQHNVVVRGAYHVEQSGQILRFESDQMHLRTAGEIMLTRTAGPAGQIRIGSDGIHVETTGSLYLRGGGCYIALHEGRVTIGAEDEAVMRVQESAVKVGASYAEVKSANVNVEASGVTAIQGSLVKLN